MKPTLATAGQKGGKSKSEAKAAASRLNGKKGGRPKKHLATIRAKVKRQLKKS